MDYNKIWYVIKLNILYVTDFLSFITIFYFASAKVVLKSSLNGIIIWDINSTEEAKFNTMS